MDKYDHLRVCPRCGKVFGMFVVDGDFGHAQSAEVIDAATAAALVLSGIEKRVHTCFSCLVAELGRD